MEKTKQEAINEVLLEMTALASKYARKVKRQKPSNITNTQIKRAMDAVRVAMELRRLAMKIRLIKSQPELKYELGGVFNKDGLGKVNGEWVVKRK